MSGMIGQSPESETGICKNELCGLKKANLSVVNAEWRDVCQDCSHTWFGLFSLG